MSTISRGILSPGNFSLLVLYTGWGMGGKQLALYELCSPHRQVIRISTLFIYNTLKTFHHFDWLKLQCQWVIWKFFWNHDISYLLITTTSAVPHRTHSNISCFINYFVLFRFDICVLMSRQVTYQPYRPTDVEARERYEKAQWRALVIVAHR